MSWWLVASLSYLTTSRTIVWAFGAAVITTVQIQVPPPHTFLVWAWLEAMRVIKINCSALQFHLNTCSALNKFALRLLWTEFRHGIGLHPQSLVKTCGFDIIQLKTEQNIDRGTAHDLIFIRYPVVINWNQFCLPTVSLWQVGVALLFRPVLLQPAAYSWHRAAGADYFSTLEHVVFFKISLKPSAFRY